MRKRSKIEKSKPRFFQCRCFDIGLKTYIAISFIRYFTIDFISHFLLSFCIDFYLALNYPLLGKQLT